MSKEMRNAIDRVRNFGKIIKESTEFDGEDTTDYDDEYTTDFDGDDLTEYVDCLDCLKEVSNGVNKVDVIRWLNENDIDYYNWDELDMYIYYIEKNGDEDFSHCLESLNKVSNGIMKMEVIRWFNENDIDYFDLDELQMYYTYIKKNSVG